MTKYNPRTVKNIVLIILLIIVTVLFVLKCKCEVAADEYSVRMNPYGEDIGKIRCTCYTANPSAKTASGKTVREGIVAGKRAWMGMTAALYEVNDDGTIGDFIGYFEFLDTGFGIDKDGDGIGSIQEGKSIDVFRDDLAGCYDWIAEHGDYVYLQIIPSKG